eukprot:1926259-Prymnesium_polylepis.1
MKRRSTIKQHPDSPAHDDDPMTAQDASQHSDNARCVQLHGPRRRVLEPTRFRLWEQTKRRFRVASPYGHHRRRPRHPGGSRGTRSRARTRGVGRAAARAVRGPVRCTSPNPRRQLHARARSTAKRWRGRR